MASTVAHMSKKELTDIMKKNLRRRLLRQKKAVARGERGMDLASVRIRLSL